ncbi:MAG: hypothetical protein ACTHM0_06875 [Sphingomonas sp.]
MTMRVLMLAAAMLMTAAQDAPAPDALTPGTVSLEMADAGHPQQALDRIALAAVGDALTDANFLILPGEGHGRYIARVAVSQESRGSVAADAHSGGGVNMAGGRLGVSLPGSKTQISGLVVTRLDLDLVARDSGKTVWHGSGSTAQIQGTPAGAPAAVVKKLADAVIRYFPRTMEEPIAVP